MSPAELTILQDRITLASKRRCAGCIFWHSGWWETGHRSGWGACKRHAPVLPPIESFAQLQEAKDPDFAGYFPATHRDEWCGEFQPSSADPPR